MKHAFIKKASLLMAGIILACNVPFSAFAETSDEDAQQVVSDLPFSLWADGNSNLPSEDQHSLDAVRWFSSKDLSKDVTFVGNVTSNQFYLLMPTTADLSALTLWHNFSEDPTINGVPIKSGESTSAITGAGDYSMVAEGKEITLTVMQSQFIGSTFIATETGNMRTVHSNKDNKESGDILVVEADGTEDYHGALSYIKGRGNTTWNLLNKKPYNIKLDKKASLLGMDESKKWCLLANAQDHTMLRNKIAYDLADEIGLVYSPDSQFTDLYLNGEYVGVYQITEKIEEGKNNLVKIKDLTNETEKVNDEELETYPQVKPDTEKGSKKYFEIPNDPKDITGGYLLEFDVDNKYDLEPSGFVTKHGQCVVVKGPEYASKAQIDYISSFVQDMEDAIYSFDGKNEKGKYYTEYLDLESAAIMYLIQEYTLNIDAGVTSFFLYKDSDENGDGKIHTAPVWDFDVALGNLETYMDETHSFKSPDAIYAATRFDWETNENLLFAELFKYKEFNDLVHTLYSERLKPALDILNSSEEVSGEHIKSIAAYKAMLDPAARMNFTRWSIKEKRLVLEAGLTFDSHIDFLLNFTTKRAEFFEEYFKPITPGEKFSVYFRNNNMHINAWDKVYLYYTGGKNTVEWPGIEMSPLEYDGWEETFKLDLAALGEEDDGSLHVIINDGGKNKTRCVPVRNNEVLLQDTVGYYIDDDTIETYEVTFKDVFNEDNLKLISYKIGDVDSDGKITSADSLKILRFSVELESPQSFEEFIQARIDEDYMVTSADALYVLRYSVGLKDNVVSPNGNKIGDLIEYYDYITDEEETASEQP